MYKKISSILPQAFLLLIAFCSSLYYIHYKTEVEISLKHEDIARQMRQSASSSVSAKQESLALIAITASYDKTLKEALKQNKLGLLGLKRFAEDLGYISDYKNVWFQIIDKDGKSFYRTWSSDRGDDLKKIRPDILDVLKAPRIVSSISIGKFDMTYKTLVPIFDGNTLIGIFEAMAKFNSVAAKLSQDGIDCLVLADKRYKTQLTAPFSKRFIGDYYVANINAKADVLQFVEQTGVGNIIAAKDFILYEKDGYLVTTYKRLDTNDSPIGFFILLKRLDSINLDGEYKSRNKSMVFALFIFTILALLLVFFQKKKEASEVLAMNARLELMVEEKTKELEEQKNILAFYAHHDSLTALPNRTLLTDRLGHAILLAKRRNGSLAALFIDLDGFKQVNDTYGHEAGDALLKSTAKKIKHILREADTVSRFGGDEFVVLLDEIEKKEEYVTTITTRILEAAREPFEVKGVVCGITCSIGISLYPKDGEDSDTLLRLADKAMYEAKSRGKNRYCFYQDTAPIGANKE
jgi:diguanylate cyclase (GGDEF)-like protein